MNIRSKEIYLTIEQVAQLLNLPEVTIQRWEHQGKIPSKLISDNVMFKKSEIINWAQIHDLAIHEQNIAADSPKIFSLSQAIKKGSIYNNIEGNDVYTVFQNVLKELPFISNSIYQQVLETYSDFAFGYYQLAQAFQMDGRSIESIAVISAVSSAVSSAGSASSTTVPASWLAKRLRSATTRRFTKESPWAPSV